ncbi:hypothetical protein K470DRAFT_267486 [Piedraia hortae CBS 480.64]|uniref:Uncharacterized protein n=1 Tax=Piedraia hortae CBS 480.64 TaxID=1314780 RepID=A0A6A7CAF7_9PEZI|nr:hypothetical protein K470DRAFT_267486 [Piedraia hortae CBS 480.64]
MAAISDMICSTNPEIAQWLTITKALISAVDFQSVSGCYLCLMPQEFCKVWTKGYDQCESRPTGSTTTPFPPRAVGATSNTNEPLASSTHSTEEPSGKSLARASELPAEQNAEIIRHLQAIYRTEDHAAYATL